MTHESGERPGILPFPAPESVARREESDAAGGPSPGRVEKTSSAIIRPGRDPIRSAS